MSLSIVAMSVQSGAENRPNEIEFERLVDAEARRLYRLAIAIVGESENAGQVSVGGALGIGAPDS